VCGDLADLFFRDGVFSGKQAGSSSETSSAFNISTQNTISRKPLQLTKKGIKNIHFTFTKFNTLEVLCKMNFLGVILKIYKIQNTKQRSYEIL
jgi:hypothetical protein